MKFLPVNSLIKYDENDGDAEVFRLIYSDIINDIGFIININTKKGLPVFRRPSMLVEGRPLGEICQ